LEFKLWAITCYFNFLHYKSKHKNYQHFYAKLGIPLITVELALDGIFELNKEDADILIQINGGAMLWQKERLLNIAIQALPEAVENVAWVDCDILFDNPAWHVEASKQLQTQHVIQLFSHAVYLNKDEIEPSLALNRHRHKGSIFAIQREGKVAYLSESEEAKKQDSMHPGFAWAAKKSLLQAIGLYDKAIIGGADSLFVCALYNEHESLSDRLHFNDAMKKHYGQWANALYDKAESRIGFIDGTVFHLWHGDLKNRRYFERYDDLAKIGFDPGEDIKIAPERAIDWARPREDLVLLMKAYFAGRDEDS
jgi:hypothetical protein